MIADPYTGEPQPNLVEKWEMPDSTHIVFHIAKGAKFHNIAPWNGRDFDAEDLAFNFDRTVGNTAAAENLPKGSFLHSDWFTAMSKVEVVDKYTAKVTLKNPSSAFIINMVDHRNMMMPKGVVEVGFKDPMKLAGLAGYQLTEFVPGVREVYSKVPGYRRAGQPHMDKIINTVVADRGAQVAGFISKQFSILTSATDQDIKTVTAARPDTLLYKGIGISWHHIRPSFKIPAFADFRVRKAMQLAIDYQEIGNGYYGPGWGYLMGLHSYYPESWNEDKVKTLPGYNPATKAQDTAEAQKLMEAAGFPQGAGMKFKQINSSAASLDSSVRLQENWKKAFPRMEVAVSSISDYAQATNALNTRTFDIRSWNHTSVPDAAIDAVTYYHTKGGRNYQSYSKPWADELLDKLLLAVTLEERRSLVQTFEKRYLTEGPPLIPIRHPADNLALQPHIAGTDMVIGPWAYNSYGVSPRWMWFTEK